MKKKVSLTLDKDILDAADRLVDNIQIRNRSQAIEHVLRSSLGGERTAVILAGGSERGIGIGRDYRPTARIGKHTVIEHAIKKLRENKFTNLFIVARSKVLTKIFQILKDGSEYGVKISYIEEKNSRGTAESLRLLRGKLDETALVVYGDILFENINIDDLWRNHQDNRFVTTLLLTTTNKPSQKGMAHVEGNSISKFIQKPKQSENYIVFNSIFIADHQIFAYDSKSLEDDTFPILAEKGLLGGYISSEKAKHVHCLADVKKFTSQKPYK